MTRRLKLQDIIPRYTATTTMTRLACVLPVLSPGHPDSASTTLPGGAQPAAQPASGRDEAFDQLLAGSYYRPCSRPTGADLQLPSQ
jgi:hypothetical protein